MKYLSNNPADHGGAVTTQATEEDRARILLKAAYDLLLKQETSSFVLNLLAESVQYDACDCDGYCLMSDIEAELDL